LKFLIVGLGNIGPEYDGTRHNIGFDVVDALARSRDAAFEAVRYCDKAEFKFKGKVFHLIKPTTFMNRSGNAVRHWVNKLGIQPENILVVVDDKDLPFGKLRMRKSGADGGHNGLANVQELLGTRDYPRLRFGIGNDFPPGGQVNYVLSPWSSDEKAEIGKYIEQAAEAIVKYATIGIERAMNEVNQ
jgi:PTH1 family peptidyl-tRNA hydrolase